IHKNLPILGVVYTPVLKKLYSAIVGKGAFLEFEQEKSPLKTSGTDIENSKVNVVASRSHINEDTQKFIDQYQEVEILSMGSSLKFMLIAEGKADVYPRIAPTMEWDTAAAQIVVTEAGGKVLNFDTKEPMQYNKENLLNPYFVVFNK
ncbi:MAG: 3'(2'),5'-bisphosphate nucleotidase CysQ, partial [Bacteroidota bacterium]